MKTLLFLATLYIGLSSSLCAQSVFKIESGETFRITNSDRKMFVDEWIMEDNSTILIDEDVSYWQINATKARFGNGCKIIGRGRNGGNGKSSRTKGGNGGECKDGGRGGNGTSGESAGNGTNIKITMGLVYVNDLYIDVRGGNGGRGGNGANGGKGGRASCGRVCSGQEGGNGGYAGNGGHGGDGGDVIVEYWIAGTSRISVGGNKGLRANTKGGYGGAGGVGGKGGQGGDGKRCGFYKRGGGSRGHNGSNGSKGSNGNKGSQDFGVLPSPR